MSINIWGMLEQNKEERAALNLKSFIINIVVGLSFQFCLLYLDHIYEDVDRSIDSEHEMVPAWQDLCPRRPDHELPIVDHLVGLIGVGDQLGGVAEEEHHHYGGEQSGHGGVPAVVNRDGVVEQRCSRNV